MTRPESGTTHQRIFSTPVADVYPLYRTKVERKGRTQAELDAVLRWLTGFDDATLARHLSEGITFAEFFGAAQLHPCEERVTGVVCGVRVEAVADPLMRRIRILDKLVDELAKGRPLGKVLRS